MEQVPCICLAGPGSGKTTVITERTKYLIEKRGISPSEILVITFTKAASIEMRGAFSQCNEGTLCTGYFWYLSCGLLLRSLKAAYHYTAEKYFKEEEKYTILRDILEPMDLEIEDEKEFLFGCHREISLIKNEADIALSIIILLIARKMCSAVFSEGISAGSDTETETGF